MPPDYIRWHDYLRLMTTLLSAAVVRPLSTCRASGLIGFATRFVVVDVGPQPLAVLLLGIGVARVQSFYDEHRDSMLIEAVMQFEKGELFEVSVLTLHDDAPQS